MSSSDPQCIRTGYTCFEHNMLYFPDIQHHNPYHISLYSPRISFERAYKWHCSKLRKLHE